MPVNFTGMEMALQKLGQRSTGAGLLNEQVYNACADRIKMLKSHVDELMILHVAMNQRCSRARTRPWAFESSTTTRTG
ncbi:MAG: hypothetical protein CMP47_15350 [Rickettsiales bacterium]|nr:hypothetical protein [Rickettsiales bacterium]